MEKAVVNADLVIGTVLIPGANAPKLIPRSLLQKMKKGAELLSGTHDFKSFCTTDPSKKDRDTTRTVYSFEVSRTGNLISLKVSADGFLYRMVRNFAGALADLGSGKISLEDLKKSLQAKDRREVGCMAPSEGLYLFNVTY